MKGLYLEVYKEDKYLSTSITVVFPNDGTDDCDHGKNQTCKLLLFILFHVKECQVIILYNRVLFVYSSPRQVG